MQILRVLSIAGLCISTLDYQCLGQNKPLIAPSKPTDTFVGEPGRHKDRVQRGELSMDNFRIAGVQLQLWRILVQDQAAKILGKVETAAWGDAADADEQSCYKAKDSDDNTHLLFDSGELLESFTLTSNPTDWKKNPHCLSTPKVNQQLQTNSGLHLGMTQEQVIQLLGLPTARSSDEKTGIAKFRYSFETNKRLVGKEEAIMRKEKKAQYTNENDFVKNYLQYNQFQEIIFRLKSNQVQSIRCNTVDSN